MRSIGYLGSDAVVGRSVRVRSEAGSAAAEFVMVGALLTVLTLGVLQLALGLHVRNTVTDAAAEGARFAALADGEAEDGVRRTRELIGLALGPDYSGDVTAGVEHLGGYSVAVVTVRVTLPLVGLVGVPRGLEVTGHAAIETAR